MLISAIYESLSREDLENKLFDQSSQILELERLLTNCGEELHKCGSGNKNLMSVIENKHRERWNYPEGYDIGTFNQMRTYIAELEQLVGKEAALKIRSNKHKYLSCWFDRTEPAE